MKSDTKTKMSQSKTSKLILPIFIIEDDDVINSQRHLWFLARNLARDIYHLNSSN